MESDDAKRDDSVAPAGAGISGPAVQGLEASIAAACGQSSFDDVLAKLQAAAPGDHAGHDYTIYRSPAGGCCDCGDLQSWAAEGCCSKHRPGQAGPRTLSDVLGRAGAQAMIAAARTVLHRIGVLATGGAHAHELFGLGVENRQEEGCRLCEWLGQLLGFAPVREQVCRIAWQPPAPRRDAALPSLHASSDSSQEAPWAQAILGSFTQVADARVLHELTTLLLLLLYDPTFKERAAVAMLGQYPTIMTWLAGGARPGDGEDGRCKALCASLDRLTVHLFNSEPLVVRLIQEHRLLQVLLSTANTLIRKVLAAMAAPDTPRDARAGHLGRLFDVFRRVMGDLDNVCYYPRATKELLGSADLLRNHFLPALGLLQFMAPQKNIPPEFPAAPFSNPAIPTAANMELIAGYQFRDVVVACAGSRPAGGPGVEDVACACQVALDYLLDWCRAVHPYHPPPPRAYAAIERGGSPVSPHLPLHRLLAKMVQGLLHFEVHGTADQAAAAQRALSDVMAQLRKRIDLPPTPAAAKDSPVPAQALGGAQLMTALWPQPAAPIVGAGSAATADAMADWAHAMEVALRQAPPLPGSDQPLTPQQREALMLGCMYARSCHSLMHSAAGLVTLAPLMLQAWLIQISRQLWRRRQDDVVYVQLACQGWRDFTIDLDLVLIQWALAALGKEGNVLMQSVLSALGAVTLVEEAGLVHPNLQAGRSLADRGIEEALRLVVALLRDRTLSGSDPRHRLRTLLLHQLASEDLGHAQLMDGLPQHLQARTGEVDEVLEELATYRPPSLSNAGRYCLRREAWSAFDPHCLHIPRRALPAALERAAQLGGYRPHWQLRPPEGRLPPSLAPMQAALALPVSLKVVAFALKCAASRMGPSCPGLSEDAALSCLNLLALQLSYMQECVEAAAGRTAHSAAAPGAGDAAQAVRDIHAMLVTDGVLACVQDLAGRDASSMAPQHGLPGSPELQDCSQYLTQKAAGVIREAQAAGLVPHAAPPSPPQSRVSDGAAGHSTPIDIMRSGGGGGGGGAAGTPPPAGSPAGDARAKARERQKAAMEAMRAKQAAFLQQATQPIPSPPSSGGPEASSGPLGRPSGEHSGMLDQTADAVEAAGGLEGGSSDESEDGWGVAGLEPSSSPARLNGISDQAAAAADAAAAPDQPAAATPALGTWRHARGTCVVCQAGGSRDGRLGPLGAVAHMSVCSALAWPLAPPSSHWLDGSPAPQPRGPAAPSAPHARSDGGKADTDDAAGLPVGRSSGPGDALALGRLARCGPAVSIADWQPGLHLHSCGHLMHLNCYQQYREDLMERQHTEARVAGHPPPGVDRPVMCPKCRRPVNCLIPSSSFAWAGGQGRRNKASEDERSRTLQPTPAPDDTPALLLPGADQLLRGLPDDRTAAQPGGRRPTWASWDAVADGAFAELAPLVQGFVQQAVNTVIRFTRIQQLALEHRASILASKLLSVRMGAATAAPPPATAATTEPLPPHTDVLPFLSRAQQPAAPPAALPAALPDPLMAAWSPLVVGETVGEAVQRWGAAALGPVLWATLAHNVAHWEAARRPRVLAPVLLDEALARSKAGPTPRGRTAGATPPSGSPAILLGTSLASAASQTPEDAPLRGQYDDISFGEGFRADVLAALLRDATDGGSGGDGVTGLGTVERAHLSALRSVAGMCAALGAGVPDAADAADHLRAAVEWLRGSHSSSGSNPSPPAPLCISAGLACEYEQNVATAQLEALILDDGRDVRQSREAGRPVRALVSRQAPTLQQLVADPFLLTLELLALALSAHARSDAAPPQLLVAAANTVLPIAAAQAAAWVSATVPATSSVSGAYITEAVCAHLLPLLMRLYVLHGLLRPDTAGAAPDPGLIARYAALEPLKAVTPTAAAGRSEAASLEPSHAGCSRLAAGLCDVLGLPGLGQLLATAQTLQDASGIADAAPPDAARRLACRWYGHILRMAAKPNTMPGWAAPAAATPRWLLPPPSLLPLPPDYQDLFLRLADKPCDICGRVVQHPCLCLLTGRLLCSWGRGCSDNRGGGMLHALEACGGTTLILALKSTKVIAVWPSQLTLCQSPYLDAHGEEDVDLRRGRPLALNPRVYGQLAALLGNAAVQFGWHMLRTSPDQVFM